MPNWCHNRWDISFDTSAEKDAFVSAVMSKDEHEGLFLDFKKVIPMPKVLEDSVADTSPWPNMYTGEPDENGRRKERPATLMEIAEKKRRGYASWYEWSIDKWGCKWQGSDFEVEDEDDDYLSLSFETPWGPPEGIYYKLREMFPDAYISAFYDEPSMELAGYLGSGF